MRVRVEAVVLDHVRPEADRLLGQLQVLALLHRVAEEGAVLARVDLVQQHDEEARVELELARELLCDLPHGIDELEEDRRRLRLRPRMNVSTAVAELVAVAEPLLLDQHDEAIQRTVVRVHQQHNQRRELRGAVPAVAAVDEHIDAGIHEVADANCRDDEQVDVLQPVGALQSREKSAAACATVREAELVELAQSVAHYVDVGDVQETQLRVLVPASVLEASADCMVGHRVGARPRVHEVEGQDSGLLGRGGLAVLVDEHDVPEQLLVLDAAGARHAHLGLAAAREAGLRFRVAPAEGRQAGPAAELLHLVQLLVRDGGRHRQHLHVGVAEAVVEVRVRDPPGGVLAEDALQLAPLVEVLPAVHCAPLRELLPVVGEAEREHVQLLGGEVDHHPRDEVAHRHGCVGE
mmetsp:Transcript_5069/g.18795  ORF Transcript_5069/g.18795 Transcript_5069/m.18795 type:complete len:407 (+) Transcript_5069:537-1757(+)